MKHTLKELQALSDEELDRLAAEVQGWKPYKDKKDWWTHRINSVAKFLYRNYRPTRDKAQAWILLEKLIDEGYALVKVMNNYAIQDCEHISLTEHKELLIAVVMAFILAMQGGNSD